jgi:MarR family transcriptional regulator, organic hydroperoxide resistance regulator
MPTNLMPANLMPAKNFDVANRLFFRLYQASNLLHKNGTRSVSAFGTTTQQWAVMGALARPATRANGASVKELMAFLLLSRQNMTAVLERLEARDWIARIKDPGDGRNRLLRMTKEGEHIWSEMQEPIERFYHQALAGMNVDDQLQLFRLLDRLKTGLHKL